jgi:hypothetical protein
MKLLALVLLAASCGGNYSNEDLDFQDALPERQDLAVKLPAQAIELADTAEYYRTTRNVVTVMTGISTAFLDLIDAVRAQVPSQREAGHRVWGPYPIGDHPGWQLRLVMDRDAAPPPSFTYSLEVKRDADWIVLLTGGYDQPGGGARGQGHLEFDSAAARAAGYQLLALDPWHRLTIDYQTREFPLSLKMNLVSELDRTETAYQYQQARDGTGDMLFDFPTPQFAPFATVLTVHSRWLGSGAGRADVRVRLGALMGRTGTDCWGIDGRSAYSRREIPPMTMTGTESACVFPSALP